MTAAPTPRSSTRVLIVDDEKLIRWTLRQHLERLGYDVVEASTGHEALSCVLGTSLETPLVVVLDLKLPDVHGLRLLHSIRDVRPRCAVIMMTAHGASADAQAAIDQGAVAVLDKPFDVQRLIELVGKAAA